MREYEETKRSGYIVAPHEPFPKRLADVIHDMARYGAPSIRAWWDGEKWIALEGSHRLAAASALGRTPKIIELSENDKITHDFEDVPGNRVRDVLEYLDLGPHYYFSKMHVL